MQPNVPNTQPGNNDQNKGAICHPPWPGDPNYCAIF